MCYTMLWYDAQSWTQFIQPNAEFEGSAPGHEAEQRKNRTAQVSENYSVVTADVVIDTDLNQFRAQLVKVNLSWYKMEMRHTGKFSQIKVCSSITS